MARRATQIRTGDDRPTDRGSLIQRLVLDRVNYISGRIVVARTQLDEARERLTSWETILASQEDELTLLVQMAKDDGYDDHLLKSQAYRDATAKPEGANDASDSSGGVVVSGSNSD